MASRKSRTIILDNEKVKTPSGLKKDGTPNVPWRKFKERLDTYDSVPLKDWKHDQFLGHIFKRYETQFGTDFVLSYSGPPSKCSEIYCVKRMTTTLGTEDPETVKAFIDWMFDEQIIAKKMQIHSLAFFFTANLIKAFKAQYFKKKKITRASQLTQSLESIINSFGITDIVTYGDLAFAKMATDMNPEDYKEYNNLFNHLNELGFDMTILENLEG